MPLLGKGPNKIYPLVDPLSPESMTTHALSIAAAHAGFWTGPLANDTHYRFRHRSREPHLAAERPSLLGCHRPWVVLRGIRSPPRWHACGRVATPRRTPPCTRRGPASRQRCHERRGRFLVLTLLPLLGVVTALFLWHAARTSAATRAAWESASLPECPTDDRDAAGLQDRGLE